MDVTKIKNTLQLAAPQELYDIAPGQVAYFVSKDGLTQFEIRILADLMIYFRRLHKDNDIRLSIIPTDNELLIGTLAGRNPEEIGAPFKVVVSTWDTVAGFASQFFGEDIQKVVESVPSAGVASRLSISADNLPVVITLNPEDCPVKKTQPTSLPAQFSCPFIDGDNDGFGMGMKIAKPEPGSKAEKALKTRMERKLEKVLRDCAILDIELDVDRIKQKVINSLKSTIDYKLALNIKTIKEDSLSFCTLCDIYVAEGEDYKLDLTAGEKAVYLTFMLYEDGIRIKETAESAFRSITQKIYNQLPDDNKCEKTAGGILDTGDVIYEIYEKTLRGDISNIRAEIDDKIANPLIAQDFAIEGFKNKEFGISNSTPELRAQIKQAFGL